MFLYLSLLKEEKIAAYRVDPGTGYLDPLGDTPTPGEPASLAGGPGGRVLYAAMRSTGALCSFAVDPESGRLDLLHTLETGLRDPAYVATDSGGRYLVTPYYESGAVTVHAIDADGAARGPQTARVDTAPHAHGVAFGPGERSVFVPHTCPGNAVWQFAFEDGRLRPNRPPRLECADGVGPRHLHLHPQNGMAYGVNEQGNSVTAYRLDAGGGALEPVQSLSTLPPGHSGGACARMEIHPSGRFLYAANRGHDSLACFRIAPSGALEGAGVFPTETTPRSFHWDPSGRFLYAAGEGNDRLSLYRVDAADGALDRLCTYVTGRVPWWVQVVAPARTAD